MRRQLKPVKRGVERSEDEEKVRRRRREQIGGGGGEERRRDETKGATDSEQTGQGSVRQGVVQQRNARRSIRAADIKQGV